MKKLIKMICRFNAWRKMNTKRSWHQRTTGALLIGAAMILIAWLIPNLLIFAFAFTLYWIILDRVTVWFGFTDSRRHELAEMPPAVILALEYIYNSDNFKRYQRRKREKFRKALKQKSQARKK